MIYFDLDGRIVRKERFVFVNSKADKVVFLMSRKHLSLLREIFITLENYKEPQQLTLHMVPKQDSQQCCSFEMLRN